MYKDSKGTFVLTNPYAHLRSTGGTNKPHGSFVCKGKHQYREVRNRSKEMDGFIEVSWVCQCGKILER